MINMLSLSVFPTGCFSIYLEIFFLVIIKIYIYLSKTFELAYATLSKEQYIKTSLILHRFYTSLIHP